MNSIIFSKMTRKQVIEAYSNKEYKKMIQMLRGIFVNRKGFLKFLNDDSNGIDNIYLRKFREILYIWTVIDEFKQLLNNTTAASSALIFLALLSISATILGFILFSSTKPGVNILEGP